MSMTKEQAIEEFNKDAESRAGKSNRLKPGILDDHYIAAYENNPIEKKVVLLRTAIKSAGIEMQATRQRAHEIHTRLSDTLEKRLIERAKNARSLGLLTLEYLCRNAQSESVKAQVATTLTKDIFPDVQVSKHESIEDIERELEQLENEARAH